MKDITIYSRSLTVSANSNYGGLGPVDLDTSSGSGGFTGYRVPSHLYPLGAAVVNYNATPTRTNTRAIFRVTAINYNGFNAGRTAATPPSGTDPFGFSTAVNGSIIIDGDVTWTAESLPRDYSSYLVPNTPSSGANFYHTGDRVLNPGDNRFYFEALNDGYTAGTGTVLFMVDRFSGQPTIYVTTTDGGITWKTHQQAAIFNLCSFMSFRNMYILVSGVLQFILKAMVQFSQIILPIMV